MEGIVNAPKDSPAPEVVTPRFSVATNWKISHKWKIHRYTTEATRGKRLTSPPFTWQIGDSRALWSFSLVIPDRTYAQGGRAQLYLNSLTDSSQRYTTRIKVRVRCKNANKVTRIESNGKSVSVVLPADHVPINLDLHSLAMAHPKKSITIVTEVMIMKTSASGKKNRIKNIEKPIGLGIDLSDAFDLPGSYSDFKVVVGIREFAVHRLVLSRASDVFARMFEIKMSECQTGQVVIEDLEPHIVEMMLRFMYSRKAPDLKDVETGISLYEAADKYQITDLVSICAAFLSESLNVITFPQLVVLTNGTMHTEDGLKSTVIKYLETNAAMILNSSQWHSFQEQNASLAYNMLKDTLIEGGRKRKHDDIS
ncbi:hypothetical protein RvY_15551 [Ramazzottius varieornatus]|uniref:BTB domain-containing protein n=1 Tax=Ramazzottius varieornatus TaxID=947166 RepID=A0A1D1VWI1_RAMVA|nr:hypothetical protein RvY_15551 [Ramazzottius varieornatus]